MKTITQIALEKKNEYEEKYKEWCLANPGYIMNGLSSKALGADMAIYCDHGDDLATLIKVYNRKGKAMSAKNQVHGHFFIVDALEEILDEYKNQHI